MGIEIKGALVLTSNFYLNKRENLGKRIIQLHHSRMLNTIIQNTINQRR